jgi:ATP-dependent RNA helicase DDX52/ROK1
MSVAQRLLFVGREDGKLLAMRQLIADGFTPPAIVFVQASSEDTAFPRQQSTHGLSHAVCYRSSLACSQKSGLRIFTER